MKTEDMPALPEPAVWRARGQIWSLAELHRQGLIDEADGLFSAEQVISYAAQAVAAERERCFRIVMDAPNVCADEHDTEDTFNAMKAMAVSAAAKMRRADQ